jgi:hypothetical protein
MANMKLSKRMEQNVQTLESQLQVVLTTLHALENARHTQHVIQVLSSTTNILQTFRTEPLGVDAVKGPTSEDVLDDLAEEMDLLKEQEIAFASIAALSSGGVNALDDDDLLAELEAMPDEPSAGSGGGTVAEINDGLEQDQAKKTMEKAALEDKL